MGIFKRLYRLISAYITVTSERLERAASDMELEDRRALREVEGLASRRDKSTAQSPDYERRTADDERVSVAYRILGLPPNSDLKAVEEKWRMLAARADPKRFPGGSDEEKKASEILRQINDAYRELREHLNPTGGRFEKLEI